jgi:hypothetical protein
MIENAKVKGECKAHLGLEAKMEGMRRTSLDNDEKSNDV